MKAFEEQWKHTLLSDKYKVIAEIYWREALEWSENQFVNKSAFEAEEAINKELRD